VKRIATALVCQRAQRLSHESRDRGVKAAIGVVAGLAASAAATAMLRSLLFGVESAPHSAQGYLMPTTIESGPTSGSTRVAEKPASVIHAWQSAPV